MNPISEGQRVPNATFRTRDGHDWVDVTSDALFSGRTVVVFSLPGAFTPTCSSSHVPRYNKLAKTFREHGVDDIVCLSVNDAFVMEEWQESQQAYNIRFIPDGNGEFTSGMGLLVDKDDLGFGQRSWRYSMLVRDGVIEKLFVEPEKPGDPFEVSDADSMLSYLAPNAVTPRDITLLTRKGCPYCAKAKQLLTTHDEAFEELVLNRDFTDSTLRAMSPVHTYPQVFVDGQRIGGSEQLETFLETARAA